MTDTVKTVRHRVYHVDTLINVAHTKAQGPTFLTFLTESDRKTRKYNSVKKLRALQFLTFVNKRCFVSRYCLPFCVACLCSVLNSSDINVSLLPVTVSNRFNRVDTFREALLKGASYCGIV